MKITFGAVEKPAPKPLAPGDVVYPNNTRDRVLLVTERHLVVLEPGYGHNDRFAEYGLSDLNMYAMTPFDSAELIVRR